jgi:hypothetical protein
MWLAPSERLAKYLEIGTNTRRVWPAPIRDHSGSQVSRGLVWLVPHVDRVLSTAKLPHSALPLEPGQRTLGDHTKNNIENTH